MAARSTDEILNHRKLFNQDCPPSYQLSAPHLRGADKTALAAGLEEVAVDNAGQPVVFLWAERVK